MSRTGGGVARGELRGAKCCCPGACSGLQRMQTQTDRARRRRAGFIRSYLSSAVVFSPPVVLRGVAEGIGRESEGSGRRSEDSGSPTEGSGRESEGSGSPTEGSGRESEGSGRESEGSGRESEDSGSPTEGGGSPTEGSGRESEGSETMIDRDKEKGRRGEQRRVKYYCPERTSHWSGRANDECASQSKQR